VQLQLIQNRFKNAPPILKRVELYWINSDGSDIKQGQLLPCDKLDTIQFECDFLLLSDCPGTREETKQAKRRSVIDLFCTSKTASISIIRAQANVLALHNISATPGLESIKIYDSLDLGSIEIPFTEDSAVLREKIKKIALTVSIKNTKRTFLLKDFVVEPTLYLSIFPTICPPLAQANA
jgi:hypothetical protein